MSPETQESVLANPALSFRNLATGFHYGLGWFVTTTRSGERYWVHGGSMPGVVSSLTVYAQGITWAWLFNASIREEQAFVDAVNGAILSAIQSVTAWPEQDQFLAYQPSNSERPELDETGVVNAASYQPLIAPGTWITLTGIRLGGEGRSWAPGDFAGQFLPVKLDGVRVIANGRPAPIAYVSDKQINALVPFSPIEEKEVWVQVVREGRASEPRQIIS